MNNPTQERIMSELNRTEFDELVQHFRPLFARIAEGQVPVKPNAHCCMNRFAG